VTNHLLDRSASGVKRIADRATLNKSYRLYFIFSYAYAILGYLKL
jgi:hypothetical protein